MPARCRYGLIGDEQERQLPTRPHIRSLPACLPACQSLLQTIATAIRCPFNYWPAAFFVFQVRDDAAARVRFFAFLALSGAVCVGVPGALIMGGVARIVRRKIASGILLTGAGLGVGSATVLPSLLAAAMSTAAGDVTGFVGYVTGSSAVLAGAAYFLFFF
jgi:hypothetical protein